MKFNKLILYDFKASPLEVEFVNNLKQYAKSVKIVFAKSEYSGTLKLLHLKNADALVTRIFDFYDDKLLAQSNLKYIGAMHTDISHFNIKLLNKKGITLTNIPNYATEAVAELTISALLNISRSTHDAMNFVKEGYWGFDKFLGWELRGKILGIIGLGKIGTRVAEIAEKLGMKIIHYTPSKRTEKNFRELKKLLKQSDVISLHCSLNKKTNKILNKSNLKFIKRGTVLLNSARSELVDLNALYKLCKQGKITAWFEAIEDEKVRDKFNKLDNVYLTPHFGWMTKEAQQKLKEITLNNIKYYLKGNPQNKVN